MAQDEESCVVFGMPREAYNRDGATEYVPLNEIAQRTIRLITEKY
jgi:two-component system chemotaxis response regulator CheB